MRKEDLAEIQDALGQCKSKRILAAFDGKGRVHIKNSDSERPTDLKAMADAGYGEYYTDGKTYEALIGYDIDTDTKNFVIYRLPRARAAPAQ
ncbi:conserved hypothetical protein [Candidatus Sulfotelmatobacter sp. SbA7]|nr:conserved hypothetical protein [Candidatus Sulfotelmatobacter sp. SbA7]